MSIRARAAALALGLTTLSLTTLGLTATTGPVQAQGAAAFPDDLPPSLVAPYELLPTGRNVCLQMGLDPQVPGRCNAFAVLAFSMKQTDRTLWFFKTTTMPGADCPSAVPFTLFKATGPVTSLCRAPEENVAITPAELAALTAEASRLNALQSKTLAEHLKALQLKTQIDCVTRRSVQECD